MSIPVLATKGNDPIHHANGIPSTIMTDVLQLCYTIISKGDGKVISKGDDKVISKGDDHVATLY